ncbi:MAG: dicarboxylate/amino acid:cation symporter [Alphaproteobacteria bacterium]|nr:dicarboxylate/amino acid:cation symporter [Alphaproteobacteria bacterium]MCD8526404.1 dicarboxylate/amino acid:cation symporter [Alphaproteobacteria bacterium]MCD8571548.1 dicarboxylate/amino acid:cation symporter [Alphaproteobacteria bacterium]
MTIHPKLWLHILIGLVCGVVVGMLLSPSGAGLLPPGTAFVLSEWLALAGRLFLGLISMVIIPLVVCSIILGINSSGDAGFVKQLSVRLIPYFVITSFIAISIGIMLTELIQPGRLVDAGTLAISQDAATNIAEKVVGGRNFSGLSIPERLMNMFPVNPLKAAVNIDLLQVVIAAILVGLAVLNLPKGKMKSFMDLCEAGQIISMKFIEWAMKIAPYAVFGLMADLAIRMGPAAFIGLGGYVITVLSGLISVMILYLLIVSVIARRSPLEFLRSIRAAQLLAFSTSSSAATMPLTLQTAEEKLGVHPDTARFVVPLGATINMDGTGLYQAVAALFLCQFFGIDLSFGEMFLLAITMVGASIGTPSTPGVGIVVLSTIVSGLGVPAAGIGMILGVDRVLDMCRTTINVTGDLTASAVMERWLHGKKSKKDKKKK